MSLTFTGVYDFSRESYPSLPLSFCPQQYASFLLSIMQVWAAPADTDFTPEKSLSFTGPGSAAEVVPLPICPISLFPQQ